VKARLTDVKIRLFLLAGAASTILAALGGTVYIRR
jgi:hypothetical protein